jgi:hypothetical protein
LYFVQSPGGGALSQEVNDAGTEQLLRALSGLGRACHFVFTSASAVMDNRTCYEALPDIVFRSTLFFCCHFFVTTQVKGNQGHLPTGSSRLQRGNGNHSRRRNPGLLFLCPHSSVFSPERLFSKDDRRMEEFMVPAKAGEFLPFFFASSAAFHGRKNRIPAFAGINRLNEQLRFSGQKSGVEK